MRSFAGTGSREIDIVKDMKSRGGFLQMNDIKATLCVNGNYPSKREK